MRILTVVYDLDIGGTQRAAVAFANAYANLGHESAIFAMQGLGSRLADLGPAVAVFGPETATDQVGSWAPDVVHVHGHGLDGEELRKLHGTPAGHATWLEQNVFAGVTPWADLIDTTFLFSRWCQFQYSSALGLHRPTALVPNPIDETRFFRDQVAGADVRRQLGVPADALVLGRIGQAQQYKWSDILIEAFEDWARDDPRAWLLVVGAPDTILARIARSDARDRVCTVDRVVGDDALRAHYSAMDFFGHVAHQGETFGYVLVEAALCELPVVTLSTPWADNSQGEVVGHEVGGLVSTTRKGFTRAVRRLAGNPAERQRLAEGARSRSLREYSASIVAQRALAAATERVNGTPPPLAELLSDYSVAVDPPGALRRRAFCARHFNALAWLSGAESGSWLARTTLNRWGVSRHGLRRTRAGAT